MHKNFVVKLDYITCLLTSCLPSSAPGR
jgi:hypothetical protein